MNRRAVIARPAQTDTASLDYSRTNAHSQKGRKSWGSGAGVFEAFDTLSFLIEAQNMVQVPVLTGFYAF
jgi:hypothetical protein